MPRGLLIAGRIIRKRRCSRNSSVTVDTVLVLSVLINLRLIIWIEELFTRDIVLVCFFAYTSNIVFIFIIVAAYYDYSYLLLLLGSIFGTLQLLSS